MYVCMYVCMYVFSGLCLIFLSHCPLTFELSSCRTPLHGIGFTLYILLEKKNNHDDKIYLIGYYKYNCYHIYMLTKIEKRILRYICQPKQAIYKFPKKCYVVDLSIIVEMCFSVGS